MNSYELSRAFFDWSFENPNKITPNHIALYFFCVEHCNRLGWKDKFGLPTTMAKEAIGIRSYNTYKKTLDELVEFGFITMVEVSKNQYSSNIIALSKFNNAHNKALDKALIKHTSKQSESTQQSISSIDKPITIKQETIEHIQIISIPTYDEFSSYAFEKETNIDFSLLKLKYEAWVVNGWKDGKDNKIKNWKSKLLQTIPHLLNKQNYTHQQKPTMRTTNEVFDNVIKRIKNGEDTTVKIIGL
jgi:hypothetical protein